MINSPRFKSLNVHHKVECNQYFQSSIESGAINLLIGEMGVGKTTSVRDYILSQRDKLPHAMRVLVITHRRALNRQISLALSIANYEDLKIEQISFDDVDSLTASPESLSRLSAANEYDLVFLDEINQLVAHTALSDTMRQYSRTTMNKILSIVSRCNTVVLSDQYVSAQLTEFLHAVHARTACVGHRRIVQHTNMYKPRKVQQARVVIYSNRSEFLAAAANARSNIDRKILAISNTRRRTEDLHHELSKNCDSVLITSKTDNSQVDLNNLDDSVKTVAYSPSIGTGVSVDAGHGFDIAFCEFGSESTTFRECQQQLARFRGLSEYHVFITGAKRAAGDVTTHAVMASYIAEFAMNYAEYSADYAYDGTPVLDDYSRIAAAVTAERNFSRHDFKNLFIESLRKEGFQIIVNSSVKNREQGAKIIAELKEIEGEERSKRINESAQMLRDQMHLDHTEAQDFAERNEKSDIVRVGLKALSIARMTEQAAASLDRKERKQLKEGKISIAEMSYHQSSRKILNEILSIAGVSSSLNINDQTWSKADTPTLKKLVHSRNHARLKSLGFNVTPASQSNPLRWFNATLKKLGFVIEVSRGDKCDRYNISQSSAETLKKLL